MDAQHVTRRRFLESAVLVVGGSSLAACQTSAPPSAAAPTSPRAAAPAVQPGAGSGSAVAIGAVMPLTGRNASLAAQVKNGYEIAFDDLNKNSKIQLQLKVLDDGSDPTNTLQQIQSITASDNPLALLGGAGSYLLAASGCSSWPAGSTSSHRALAR